MANDTMMKRYVLVFSLSPCYLAPSNYIPSCRPRHLRPRTADLDVFRRPVNRMPDALTSFSTGTGYAREPPALVCFLLSVT